MTPCRHTYPGPSGRTPALERESIDAPIDARSAAPLHLASRFGHFEVVERLVELGADVEKKDVRCA